jgi:RecB family exonuclease
LECFADLAQDIGSLPETFRVTPLRGEQALRLWLDWTADQALHGARAPAAIEALGWLELAMEEAPFLLLVGLNDGWVPQIQRAHPLLGPDGAQAASDRAGARLARDIHALTAIALQRGGDPKLRNLRALSLRRGSGEDPLRPSRLLFHAANELAIARARVFYPTRTESIGAASIADPVAKASVAVMPMKAPRPARPVRISSFKTFLTSPYLYYLQNVLGLKRVRDDAWELDALGFGSLVHDDVLMPFGKSDCKDSTDSKRVEEFLLAQLRTAARERFGEKPQPAVRLQLQQLERRLSAFADHQVLEAISGWRIDAVELNIEGAALDVDGVAVEIRGRVDRIDRHTDGRRWRILDYKTGDDGTKPRAAHLTKNGWLDLQLPLYRHFLRERLPGELELGYFAIPRELEDCGVYPVKFESEEYDSALDEARRVLREILAGRFAHAGRARPTDRVQRALFGLSLLSLTDDSGADEDLEAGEDVE